MVLPRTCACGGQSATEGGIYEGLAAVKGGVIGLRGGVGAGVCVHAHTCICVT